MAWREERREITMNFIIDRLSLKVRKPNAASG